MVGGGTILRDAGPESKKPVRALALPAAAASLGAPAPPVKPIPILLLVCSNIFMTLAWYGQLRLKIFEGKALWVVILMSWGIAFFEYCLMVPANKAGYAQGLSGYQLKIMQEVITLTVFVGFAWLVLGEKLRWNYAVSFALILLAVYFATAFNKPAGAAH